MENEKAMKKIAKAWLIAYFVIAFFVANVYDTLDRACFKEIRPLWFETTLMASVWVISAPVALLSGGMRWSGCGQQ